MTHNQLSSAQLLLQVTTGRRLVVSRPFPCHQKKTLPRPGGIKLGLCQLVETPFLSLILGIGSSSWEEGMMIGNKRTQCCHLMMGEKTGIFCRTDWKWQPMVILQSAQFVPNKVLLSIWQNRLTLHWLTSRQIKKFNWFVCSFSSTFCLLWIFQTTI